MLRPDFAEAYLNRALCKYSLQDYKGAIEDYSLTIMLRPNFAEAYYSRGTSKSCLKDNKGAIDDYN